MTDTLAPEERSKRMSLIRSKDTKPELIVRRLVYSLGYRYRLHFRGLPGTPDLVFHGRRKVVFVHGCFWHQHAGCKLAKLPKTRQEYWRPKLSGNYERDQENRRILNKLGWKVLVIWECETKDRKDLEKRLKRFLR